ncbi:carboxylesterase [Halobacterium sp. DL1]|jgi:pimeloyl-ACP methyl ester carboxylesterase|nr:carboxylesterase [Halobacterium sp. DL1]
METVTHGGRRTAYRLVDRGGDGAPLLCVHGSGGTHAVWKSQLGRLSRKRPVAALDLSGHGDSDDLALDAGPDVLDAYARDVLAVATEVGARAVLGNSLGGGVVLSALLDHDADVEAVVLAGSGAKLSVHEDLRRWLAGEDGGFDRAIEFLHGDGRLFHDPTDAELAFSQRAMREAGREVVERDFLTSHAFDVRDRLGELDVPLLALTGEHDGLTPPAFHEYLAENVQDGSWTTLPDAAHLSMLEAPDAFNDAVSAFLEARRL